MKTIVLSAIIALVCSFSCLQAQPKIQVVEGTNIDFGDITTGQKSEHVLTIKNIGKDTLIINDVKASCGCTATMISERILPPTKEGKLSIAFNTASYGGKKVTKQVFITSNDTSNARVTVNFTANVVNVLDLSPGVMTFDQAKLDSTYTKVIVIKNPAKKPVTITSAQTKFDQIKFKLLKTDLGPGEQTELQVTLHATKPGTFQNSINLTTDNPMQSNFEVKVYAWINRK